MPADPVSVTLVVGAAPYQKRLAARILSAGMLRRVIDVLPQLEMREPDDEGSLSLVKNFPAFTLAKRVVWGIWRRFPPSVQPRPPMMLNAWLADQLVARNIPSCRIFHGCTAISLASIRAAKERGAIALVENASCHPRDWRKVEREEDERFGMSSREGSGIQTERMLRRMEREFEECDWIVVPSNVARRSFAEHGYGKKTVVVQTGVDAEYVSPEPRIAQPQKIFRACYVGRVEPAKGVGYLLQAWKRLALPHAELVLVGAVKPQMKSLVKSYEGCGVRVAGTLPPSEVARCYRESSMFVMPSPNEGLAQVLLEAMASALPVVATDRTGANDCMVNGKEGLIVPARNPDALAEAIRWCYQHPEESQTMGEAARARIECEFTLEHYNQRVIALYRALSPAV